MSTENGAWRNCDQENSAACNFRPDYELSTPRAQQWAAESQAQRSQPIELDQNGLYQVRFGDSLSTLAERALRQSGAAVNKESLQGMQDAIVDANRDRYKTLDCNRDFLSEKWKLKIPPCQRQEEPPVRVEPPVTYEPPVPVEPPVRYEPPVRRPCPPQERPPIQYEEYDNFPPPRDYYPRGPVINNYGELNIFLGRDNWGRQQDWGRDRDYYQWSDRRDCPRPQIYRPDYYHEPYRPEPRGCGPCEQRQYRHDRRMPQVLRRNPVYDR